MGNDFFSVAPVFFKGFYMFLHNFFCLKYLEPPILVIFGHKIWNVIPCTVSGTPVGREGEGRQGQGAGWPWAQREEIRMDFAFLY
jgi:hypothetical protein